MSGIETGQILWTPTDAFKTASNLHRYQLWLKETRGVPVGGKLLPLNG